MPKKVDVEGTVSPDFMAAVDEVAEAVAAQMSPLDMGLLVHPHAEPVKLKRVPADVIEDHLTRYSKAELKRGQFLRVGDRYVFFMDRKAKAKRDRKAQGQ